MYMRSIAYIAILAFAATQGMEFPCDVKYIFEPKPTISVKGCSPDEKTIRCHSGNGRTAAENTERCVQDTGIARSCYCWSHGEYFTIANNNFEVFKNCCIEQSGKSGVDQCWIRGDCGRLVYEELRCGGIFTYMMCLILRDRKHVGIGMSYCLAFGSTEEARS